jgi:hypothetical protein
MVAKKPIGVTGTSLIAIATLTTCLSAEQAVAREIFSPRVAPAKMPPVLGKYRFGSTSLFTDRPNLSFTKRLSERLRSPSANGDLFAPIATRSTVTDPPNLSIYGTNSTPQIDIFYNPDLASVVNNFSLSDALPQSKVARINKPQPSIQSDVGQLVATTDLAQTVVPRTVPPAPEVEELVRQVRTSLTPTAAPEYTPAISFVTPIGYGGYYGNVGLGVAYQASTALGNKDDGNFGATVSLGDPSKYVGIDLTFTVNSISNEPFRGSGGTLGSTTLTLQLSRLISDDWSFGIGAENLVAFDARNISTTKSYYGVTTKVFRLDRDRRKPFSTLYASLGVGNGRFLPAGKVTVQGEPGVNVFGSVAVQAIEGVNGIVEWSGQDLDLAVSVVPFRNIPLAITPAVVDLIGTSQNRGARFNISVGYSFNF